MEDYPGPVPGDLVGTLPIRAGVTPQECPTPTSKTSGSTSMGEVVRQETWRHNFDPSSTQRNAGVITPASLGSFLIAGRHTVTFELPSNRGPVVRLERSLNVQSTYVLTWQQGQDRTILAGESVTWQLGITSIFRPISSWNLEYDGMNIHSRRYSDAWPLTDAAEATWRTWEPGRHEITVTVQPFGGAARRIRTTLTVLPLVTGRITTGKPVTAGRRATIGASSRGTMRSPSPARRSPCNVGCRAQAPSGELSPAARVEPKAT